MAERSGERTAALFDLDGTLLTINSVRLWARRERREGRWGMRELAKASLYLLLYRVGAIDMERAVEEALSTIQGLEEASFRDQTREWFHDEVVPWSAPGAWTAIEEHRRAGHFLGLITSSSPYMAECATEYFDLDGFRATYYEVDNGVFTGEFVDPLCFGSGKIDHAEDMANKYGFELSESYFYTDSNTDLPLLRRVKHPRPVHPDARLRLEALARGWPVLDWREETSKDEAPVIISS